MLGEREVLWGEAKKRGTEAQPQAATQTTSRDLRHAHMVGARGAGEKP